MNDKLSSVSFFQPSEIPLTTFVTAIAICLIIAGLIYYFYKSYDRMRKEKNLRDEMDMLDFGNEESSTLFDMVKRHTLNEPVEVLYSLKLFDELAQEEIARVLSSAMSSDSKGKYVEMIYNIRRKTYFAQIQEEPTGEPIPQT